MLYLRRAAISFISVGTIVSAGCADDVPIVALDSPSHEIAFSTGVGQLDESGIQHRMVELTKALAIALEDSSLRERILLAMQSSHYAERKVHFGDLVASAGEHAGAGDDLAGALGRAIGDGSDVLALLDSVVDLEMYIPVDEHRRIWDGGTNLIVATAFRDGDVPVGFMVGGTEVELSEDVAPTLPVLAIVPAEENFRRGQSQVMSVNDEECDPETVIIPCDDDPTGSPPPTPTEEGIWMNGAHIDDDHEGWLMGNPEFEIITADRATSQGQYNELVQCAGEHAQSSSDQPGINAAEFVYDQNNVSWGGLVQLATLDQMADAQAYDNGAIFMVWEDDATACQIRQGSINTKNWVLGAASVVQGYRAYQKKTGLDQILSAVSLLSTAWTLVSSLSSDDFVGLLVVEGQVGQSTSDFTHAIVNKDGNLAGRANIIVVP